MGVTVNKLGVPAVATVMALCCQVAEISARKLKRGQGKIKLAGRICGRILAEFDQKGPENIFL
jgi:hypothetical protein